MNKKVYGFLFAWINLAQAVIGVITFGIWYPNWVISFARWYALYCIKKQKEV